MKLFRRKITPEYIRKHYSDQIADVFEVYKIGKIKELHHKFNVLFIRIMENKISLFRGYNSTDTWICDIEYIYQLKQILKIYKIL